MEKQKVSPGFTLIEILIVIAISALLAVAAVGFSSSSRDQVALSVETAKIGQLLLTAKNLSVARYNNSLLTCAYGVSFNIASNTYSVFAYNPAPAKYGGHIPPCPSTASTTALGINLTNEAVEYDPTLWNIPVSQGVKMVAGTANDSVAVVIFYPPDPDTMITLTTAPGVFLKPTATSKVYLETNDDSASDTVTINPAGQISF